MGLALMLRIHHVSGLYIGPETGYHECGFRGLYIYTHIFVSPDKLRVMSNGPQPLPSKSFRIDHVQ